MKRQHFFVSLVLSTCFATGLLYYGYFWNLRLAAETAREITHSTSSSKTDSGAGLSQALRLANLDSPSKLWAPLSLSTCQFGMPHFYAPCVAQRTQGAVYAEELLYPDFEIREPIFLKEEYRVRWRNVANTLRDRAVLQGHGYLLYKGQTGQNYIFANASLEKPSRWDAWSSDSCMSDFATSSLIKSTELGSLPPDQLILPSVLVASSPDSFSFQHHLDRITHIVTQAAHLSAHEVPHVFTGRRGNKFVQDLWRHLGYESDHMLYRPVIPVVASKVIFSCRAVLVHPWLSLKTLEAFGIDREKPSSQRTKIVYMSRTTTHINNRGRKVLNEKDLLEAINTFLEERGMGEELVMFDEGNFPDAESAFNWFGENVAAIIGPHGGALHHHRWAAKNTLVIEMMPTTFSRLSFYEEASVLSQIYAAVIVEPSSPQGTNFNVNVDDIIDILRKHFRPTIEPEDPLRSVYHWKAPELYDR